VGNPGGKNRPTLVVQCDALNAVINETIIAEITSNLAHVNKPHQVRIDVGTPDGATSGLLTDSAVRCERLHTIPRNRVLRILGALSPKLMQQVDLTLKAALSTS